MIISLMLALGSMKGKRRINMEININWHTPEKMHGCIINLTQSQANEVNKYLIQKYSAYSKGRGIKGAWWTKSEKNPSLLNVEFIDMTRSRYCYRWPWQYDGFTFLMGALKAAEEKRQVLSSQFRFGDDVYFDHQGSRHYGQIIGGRTRATVMVGNMKWRVSYSLLHHDDRKMKEVIDLTLPTDLSVESEWKDDNNNE
jgi:hypothetical protein